MRTIEAEHPADTSAGTRITPEAIRSYLDGLAAKGRGTGTVQNYTNKLLTFYEELPADKRVTRGALEDWRQKLLERGYSPNTVNTYLTAVNGLLAHMDRRDLQLVDRLELRPEIQPELTRAEYLRLLGAARALDRERTYLLVKLFALTGLRVGEVPRVTVAAVESGRMKVAGPGGKTGYRPIPTCLREELRSYLRRTGVSAGQVFVTRNGRPVRRTQISMEIRSLSQPARVTEEKCNPRCLRKLYQATQAEIDRSVRLLAEQAWDRMMENEQLTVGWDAEEGVRDV